MRNDETLSHHICMDFLGILLLQVLFIRIMVCVVKCLMCFMESESRRSLFLLQQILIAFLLQQTLHHTSSMQHLIFLS